MLKEKAEQLFTETPKRGNCAQCVALAAGDETLAGELNGCGGGKAPEGLCGALYAAMLLAPAEKRQAIHDEFQRRARGLCGRELKQARHYPCAACVALAAELFENQTQKK